MSRVHASLLQLCLSNQQVAIGNCRDCNRFNECAICMLPTVVLQIIAFRPYCSFASVHIQYYIGSNLMILKTNNTDSQLTDDR